MSTIEIQNRNLFSIIQLCVVALILFAALGFPLSAEAATYVVNSEDDEDDGVCNALHCSLREAINAANENPGADQITFNIPGAGDHTIELTDSLPALTDNATTIDGSTQPGYAGEPLVILNGVDIVKGLRIESANNVIRGLYLINFGTEDSRDVETSAIYVSGESNSIEDNVISANLNYGMSFYSGHNSVTGNMIGVGADGRPSSGNGGNGIVIDQGNFNTIGGPEPGEGNVISGNAELGIFIYNCEGNRILGNIIGGDANGEISIPNDAGGIYLGFVRSAEIGGPNPGEGNVIFGNNFEGIDMMDSNNITVAGNIIHDNGSSGISHDYGDIRNGVIYITRNSIYDNGELGIFKHSSTNTTIVDTVADELPLIEHATPSEVSGTACDGCLVEAFLAAPDPTLHGEGKTFLGEAVANAAGEWSIFISDVGYCDQITATSTETDVGTSEFSQNAFVEPCLVIGRHVMLPVVVILAFLFVGLGRGLWPEPPIALHLFLSVLFTAGIVLVLVLIPFVKLDFSPGKESRPEPVPDCGDFIDPQSVTPLDGQVFDLQDDPLLSWQPSGDLLEGEIRWQVDLRSPDQGLSSQTSEANEMAFSTFGLTPQAGAGYDWYLNGELKSEAQGTFEPFCEDWKPHFFEFVDTPIEEAAQVEEQEEVEEAEACTPSVTATMNATCRFGPNKVFEDLGYLLEGESELALAQTQGAGWYQIFLQDKVECWVWSGAVTAECSDDLQILEGPPPPTATPTSEPIVIDEEGPPAPNTLLPKNGETLDCAASVPLQWSAVDDPSGIAGYSIQVERGPQWAPASGSPFTTTNTAINFDIGCGLFYRWRVRAEDGAGNIGSWSAWSEFDVILP